MTQAIDKFDANALGTEGPGDRAVEMDWLAEHGNELAKRYAGQWIAISGAQLVASAPNLRTLLKRAAKAGHPDPLITAIPAEPVLRLHV